MYKVIFPILLLFSLILNSIFLLTVNCLIMDYLVSKFQKLVTPENDYPFESAPCAVVPNASISSREIFNLYSRGVEVPHLNHQNEPVIHGGYYPNDPMDALQCANDYVAALPSAGSSEPQTGSTEPLTSASDTSAPSAAE